MASAAQCTANRANAQYSTGPVTDEGKRHSSRNSTSHGLTSKDVSVPEGLAGEFDALRENLESALNPETPMQMVFYNQALSAAWRQFLCDHATANLDQMVSTPGLNPLLDPKLEPTIRTIERVRAQAAKLLAKAIAELRKIQTEEQYRAASMPEDQGYKTEGLGVADWQTINKKLQNEAKARREQSFYAPSPLPPEFAQDATPQVLAALAALKANPSLNPMDPASPYYEAN